MNDVKTLKFIEKSINVHGSKYDYSLVEYTTSQHKVKIVCPIHGAFEQIANNHIRGKGCSKCGNAAMKSKQSSTTDSFINSSKRIHKSYDYSLVEYKNNRTKVKIICDKHGIFEQTPNDHLSGRGCPKCRYDKSSSALKSNNEDFINKANLVHNNKYDYSLVEYIGNKIKVKIICPEHGVFEQTPDSHLRHRGCNICGYNKSSSLLKPDNEEFINKSNSVHNNRYDYSLVSYVNAKTKVLITCLIHGEFKQTPDAHLHGSGCPKCFDKVSRKELELLSFIQENTDEDIITNKSPTFFESNHHLDIYIPNLNIAFEFNGEYWHSEDFGRGEDYHRYKFNKCKEAGVKLLHVWENDWKNNIEMVKELIVRMLNDAVEFDELEKFVWK